MTTARVFKSGNSQSSSLAQRVRLKGQEVEIFRRGEEIVFLERQNGMSRAFDLLANLPADMFSEERRNDPPQSREEL